MTSLELTALAPDAADRLARAICTYGQGSLTIEEVYAIAVSGFGQDQALVALTNALSDTDIEQDLRDTRDAYRSPVLAGYDMALEKALASKLAPRLTQGKA